MQQQQPTSSSRPLVRCCYCCCFCFCGFRHVAVWRASLLPPLVLRLYFARTELKCDADDVLGQPSCCSRSPRVCDVSWHIGHVKFAESCKCTRYAEQWTDGGCSVERLWSVLARRPSLCLHSVSSSSPLQRKRRRCWYFSEVDTARVGLLHV